MSLRGTGQGGFLPRTWELFDVLGSVGVFSPSFAMAFGRSVRQWGSTPAAGFAASAERRPDDLGLIDDDGTMTFGELEARSNAIANGLAAAGVKAGDGVGLFARNHRGFVLATLALGKLGANSMLLNTGFAAPQLREVLEREGSTVVLYDEEFASVVEQGAEGRQAFITYSEGGATLPHPTLDELASGHDSGAPVPPSVHGRQTILTSGTTGTPKGAQRAAKSGGLEGLVGLLGRMPLRVGERTFVAAPAFHSWGGAHLMMAGLLSCTVVMQRRFDPAATLRGITEHRPDVLAVVPVMIQRMLAVEAEELARCEGDTLRVVAASGSALPGELAIRWMNRFGDNLHNFYGSTEVAQATIAMPDELRAAPGTAGRAPRGTIVKIFDENGKELPAGATGRIFVGNDNQFEGYTGGGNKELIQGLMSSGDVGHFDADGRLFVDGRDDDMIVSGGENVFPREVEDLLSDHDAITEAAVIGVADQEFGQRLKGFVVLDEGCSVTEAELKTYVKEHLARYKVPRDIVFLDALPRNPTGKVLKRVLAESE